jgi:hypothetical protein
VLISRPLFVDEPVQATIIVTTDRAIRIDFIDVKVRGRQGWLISTGESSSGIRRDVPSLALRLVGEGELSLGEHRFPVSFELPPPTAPTHELRPAYSRLLVDVHVSIPWWPDGRYSFTAPVRVKPPEHLERTPVLTRQPFAPKGNEPRIELSLASSTLVAGEMLAGSVAVFHLSDDKPRVVTLSFDALLALHGYGRPVSRLGAGYQSTVTIPTGGAGEAVPFRVALPTSMPPSFTSVTHDVSWVLTASTGSVFSGKLKLQVPLTIVDARAAAQVTPLTLAPQVADQRVVAAFERLSRQTGMRLVDGGGEHPDEIPAVTRDIGDTHVRLGYAYRGTDGTFLCGRIAYPSLGLGLSVTPTSPLVDALRRDIHVDVSAWDRHHHVEARYAEQAVPFLRGALPGAASGDLVRWTDDELVTARSIGSIEDADLAAMTESLVSLAESIDAARGLIGPPPGLDVDEAAWRDLAQRVRGTLSLGDLSIHGTLDMQPVSLGLVFDERDQPTTMGIAVGAPNEVNALPITDRVRQLLLDIEAELPGVALRDGVASATLAADNGGIDAPRVLEVARTLRGVLAALAEGDGPYR